MTARRGNSSKQILIRSEADAWKALSQVLKDPDDFEDVDLVFDGWPTLHIIVSVGQSSIKPTLMRAFVDFQDALWRSHALLNYGDANISRLKDDEKAALELDIRVKGGSSDFSAKAWETIEKLREGILNKMDGKQITIVLTVMALGYYGTDTWKAHLQDRLQAQQMEYAHEEKMKTIEAQVTLTQEETRRMGLLDQAYKKVAALQDAVHQADEARTAFLKGVPGDGTVNLQGNIITGSVAHELAKNPRETLSGNVVEGIFSVQQVDARSSDGFRVMLRNLATGASFSAKLADDLEGTSRSVIERATFEKKPIRASVEVSKRRGKIEKAKIVKASRAPENWKAELGLKGKKARKQS